MMIKNNNRIFHQEMLEDENDIDTLVELIPLNDEEYLQALLESDLEEEDDDFFENTIEPSIEMLLHAECIIH